MINVIPYVKPVSKLRINALLVFIGREPLQISVRAQMVLTLSPVRTRVEFAILLAKNAQDLMKMIVLNVEFIELKMV